MGFRSTFTTEDYGIHWPDWFFDKYKETVFFREDHKGTIAAKFEAKTYGDMQALPGDIQRAIDWSGFGLDSFVLVYLHECGGITRCQIEKSAIKWSEPDSWRIESEIQHHYCHGCSDVGEK